MARPGVSVVFHDGFRPLLFTGALSARRDHPVVMDAHWYAFRFGEGVTFDGYERRLQQTRRWLLWWLQRWQPVLVGEWSTVLPQELFDATPQKGHRELLRRNANLQQQIYDKALGNFYWNYRAEGRGMWHFRSLVEDGIISTSS